MNKYIIKFFKTGNMKYISHLDIMNVFQRAFRRAEIKLAYSQGFSPHPKLSIAHPLSLGIESIGEYMEVELVDHHNPQDLQLALNRQLPKGIGLLSVKEMTKKIKSIAAEIQFGEYELSFPKGELDYSQLEKAIHDFLELEEILVIKKTKEEKKKNRKRG